MIQQTISLFFFYPLYIFPIILGFYIWHAIGKRNIEIEKKYFWTFSSLTWCFTACFNVFSFADGYVNGHFDTRVTPLLCKPPNSMLHRISYLITIPPLFCMTLTFICKKCLNSIYLFWLWNLLNLENNVFLFTKYRVRKCNVMETLAAFLCKEKSMDSSKIRTCITFLCMQCYVHDFSWDLFIV